MIKKHTILLLTALIALVSFVLAATQESSESTSTTSKADAKPEARRLEVLFLGSPNSSHRPLDRFHTIRRAHGIKGINYTYANQPSALTTENLAKYDALVVYGNHDKISKDQETALIDYSTKGGACVFLHSACGCFRFK